MSQLSALLRSADDRLVFWCPGCDEPHAVRVGVAEHPCWTYNGNPDAPTFAPSLLVQGTRLTPEGEAMLDRGEVPASGRLPSAPSRCHSFVRDGRIEFLSDCTHALAGQTVPLPAWPTGDEIYT